MEFFIKQNSERPLLMVEISRDYSALVHSHFDSDIENALIRFSMKDMTNGTYKVLMNTAFLTYKKLNNPDAPDEFYIFYKWYKKDTNKKGRYEGEFHISNHKGEITLPLNEKLYINIV